MFKASAMAIGIVVLTAMGAPAQDRAADKAAVEATFKEMANAYASSDLKKVVSFYNDPFFSPGQGKAIGGSELEKWVEGIRASFPKDYAKFNLKQFSAKPLGKDIVILSYVGERLNKDGKVLETSANTALWKRTDKGWKFLTSVTHPPEDYIKLD